MWKVLLKVLFWPITVGIAVFTSVGEWLWTGVSALFVAGFHALMALMPASWVSFLNQTPLDSVVDLFKVLNWLFPIQAVLAIAVVSLGICAAIRLVRWVMALVPGVSIFGNSVGPFGGA